jgi:hypothetical protein
MTTPSTDRGLGEAGGRQASSAGTAGSASTTVLVDGSNVAHSTEGAQPQLANILAVRRKLCDEGKEPIVVADAALRHQIDDRAAYEKLVDEGVIRQAPAGTDADYFLLSFARELDARIVTNDRFRDRARQFADAQERLVRFMIVDHEVVFEWRAHRRDD